MAKPTPTRTPSRAGRPARRAGRPPASAPDLREQLLDAAIACYVRQGIAATPLRAIAQEAAVTPAMLHYYFGDRQQLLQAVVEERLMPAFAGMRADLVQAGDDLAALVTAFVDGIARLVERHPWLPALWIREVLCEGGALRELMLSRVGPQLPRMLADRFDAARRKGQLHPAFDPRLLVVSLVGLTLFPAAGAPIWRQFFAADDLDGEALRRHTLALLAGGLGIRLD